MVKESRYVKLAHTMLCILKNARMLSLFINRKSNHIFTVWQHLVLLSKRQYESKSYRMFTAEWLVVVAYYLRMFLKLSRIIPHFTTLQKFTDRITGIIHSGKDNYFFFHSPYNNCQTNIAWNRLIWIQANPTHHSIYYTERSGLRKKWIKKLSVGGDMLKQIISTTIKIRRSPKRHDNNTDFQPIITRTAEIRPLSIIAVVCDKGYESEKNHVLMREKV